MSWITGTATDAQDLVDQLDAFLTLGHALEIVYDPANTGDGKVTGAIGTAASVLETITLVCTAESPNAGTFSVTGSVSGSLGSATVGTPFSSAVVEFTITDGANDWDVGDEITFVMTTPWEQMRGVAGDEYIWRAPGNDDASSIYVGAKYFENLGTDYYNLRLGGFTGFDDPSGFTAQPGACTRVILPLWNQSIPFWFFASGRRAIVVAKVSTVYESAYLGLLAAYGSPGEFPYPLVVGGGMAFSTEPASTSSSWRFSNVTDEHRAFPMAGAPGSVFETFKDDSLQLRLRKMDGLYRGFACRYSAAYQENLTGSIWPYSQTLSEVRPNLDGSFSILPVVLSESIPNCYGELDGVFYLTGHNQGAENTVTIGRLDYLVVQNVFRTAKADYFAVRMS